MESPYLEEVEIIIHYKYNPNYGDNMTCTCGHAYYRHFDGYDDNYNCGCKYCECSHFIEPLKINQQLALLHNKPVYFYKSIDQPLKTKNIANYTVVYYINLLDNKENIVSIKVDNEYGNNELSYHEVCIKCNELGLTRFPIISDMFTFDANVHTLEYIGDMKKKLNIDNITFSDMSNTIKVSI